MYRGGAAKAKSTPPSDAVGRDAMMVRRELTTRAKKFLELLFRLLATLYTEETAEGRPASALLVCYSGILELLPD
jgi:hypothetical protein